MRAIFVTSGLVFAVLALAVASDVVSLHATSRSVDLYAIPPDRVEGVTVDGGKFSSLVANSVADGLLDARPLHPSLDQILSTSTPSPTLAPTPSPAPYVPSVQTWYPDPGWAAYLRSYTDDYPWDADRAVAIMLCESGGNSTSVSPYGYWGAWQIDYWFEGWDTLEGNTAAAYLKYVSAGGWSPWPVCRYR
jgi:hypothetical protein